jgi:pimeloyl-ACP methyl ester carboxylesterase
VSTARVGPTAELKLEVPGRAAGVENVSIGTSVFLPEERRRGSLLFCIPGGTYRRSYFHPANPELAAYSFAGALAARGLAVATVDIPGVGDSTRPPDGRVLTLDTTTSILASAVAQLVDGLSSGSVSEVGSFEPTAVLFLGHSLGGMLVIALQAATGVACGLAVLGWSNQRIERHGAPVASAAALDVFEGYVSIPSRGRRALFHMDDVPDDVVVEDETHMVAPVPLPLYETTVTPGVVAPSAMRIAVPVMLVFGERDTSPDPDAEVATYRRAPEVTLLRLAGSGHCHNFARSRTLLWDRVAAWAGSVTATSW